MASNPNNGQRTLDSWFSARPSSRPVASSSEQTSSSRQASLNQHPYASVNGRNDPYRRGTALAATAKETRIALPNILSQLPNIHASRSEALFYSKLPALKAIDCPRRTPSGKTTIKIVNDDSFNAAISLASSKSPSSGRVAVLNMASHSSPGGGWLKGARAQEEALCYRSSLYLSLHRRYYPWKQRMGLYSPDVVIIRSDQDSGHNLLVPNVQPSDLPVVSILSIAALRTPDVSNVVVNTPGGSVTEPIFAKPGDRELTKLKMRLCLRMAAQRNHGLLVLGALGCGAFRNPPKEVARCWLEVLKEPEFQGGWWEEIWFAVFDKRGEGNLEIFEEILDGVEV
ncbi:Ff.00g073960.m01.CDS01 [Fusarium sp. VM40]|nr:Ff.00g073960.m01.CDS01 [Fusarium sp. VM40]